MRGFRRFGEIASSPGSRFCETIRGRIPPSLSNPVAVAAREVDIDRSIAVGRTNAAASTPDAASAASPTTVYPRFQEAQAAHAERGVVTDDQDGPGHGQQGIRRG